MDEVALYKSVLSSTRITAHYTAASGGGSDTTAPSVPTAVTATAISSSRIDVSWAPSTDNTGVQGYRLYRDGSLVTTVGSTQAFDTGLTAGSAHSYTVAAIDGAGNASAQSSSAGATAQASPVRTTSYAYDSLDRLTTISPAGGTASAFGFDALGRHATRTTGALTETYAYAGDSATAVRISGGANPVDAAVDARGSRLAGGLRSPANPTCYDRC